MFYTIEDGESVTSSAGKSVEEEMNWLVKERGLGEYAMNERSIEEVNILMCDIIYESMKGV